MLMFTPEQSPLSVVAQLARQRFPGADETLVINSKTDTNQNSALLLITYGTQAQFVVLITFLFLHLNIKNCFIYAMYLLRTYSVPGNVSEGTMIIHY